MAEELNAAENQLVHESREGVRTAQELIGIRQRAEAQVEPNQDKLASYQVALDSSRRELAAHVATEAVFQESFQDELASIATKEATLKEKLSQSDRTSEEYMEAEQAGIRLDAGEAPVKVERDRLTANGESLAERLKLLEKKTGDAVSTAAEATNELKIAQIREEADRAKSQQFAIDNQSGLEQSGLEGAAKKMMDAEQDANTEKIVDLSEERSRLQRLNADNMERERVSDAGFAARNQDVLEAAARKEMEADLASRPTPEAPPQ